jgi:DNA-binding protein HU-beta
MTSISLKSALVAAVAATTISFSTIPASAMNKEDLVNSMAQGASISKSQAEKALNAFTAATAKALKKGERVAIAGFGSFSVSTRPARTGRNPQTGKPIKVKARTVVRFKAGSALSDAVN